MNRIDQLKIVQKEGLDLFTKKNQDYGDAFATYGTVGVLVRIGDKIQRLQSITNKGITLVEDERLRDTLIDLHNYAGMAVMLMDENEKNLNNGIIPPHPSPCDPLKKQKFDNFPKCEEIIITGSKGNKYVMKKYIQENNTYHITCSCPSFTYCKLNYKTCKHITNYLAENKM